MPQNNAIVLILTRGRQTQLSYSSRAMFMRVEYNTVQKTNILDAVAVKVCHHTETTIVEFATFFLRLRLIYREVLLAIRFLNFTTRHAVAHNA